MEVTRNLFKALRRLRQAVGVRTIWIDALCINQNDNVEKASQVARMAEIYQSCSKVWIFLSDYETEPNGPRDTRTVEETNDLIWYSERPQFPLDSGYGAFATVFDFAKSKNRHLDEIPIFKSENIPSGRQLRIVSSTAFQALNALVETMNVDWWRRIWVLQEAVLSPIAMVVLGSIHMPFEVFAIAATCLEIHSKCCGELLVSEPGLKQLVEKFIIAVMQIGWTRLYRKDRADGYSPQIHHLLWQYRSHKSTDPRDMIFALLSFITDKDDLAELAPDYTISKKEVYKRAVLCSVRSSKKLYILQGRRNPSIKSDMPSWIYDWSVPMKPFEWHLERQRLRNSDYLTSGEEGPYFSCNRDELSLKGIFVDLVVSIGSEMDGSRKLQVSKWRKILRLPNEEKKSYIGGEEDLESAFWRTVTRDYTWTSTKTFQRIQDRNGHVIAGLEWLECTLNRTIFTSPTRDFENLIGNLSVGQQFFLTETGYMGMGNPEPGDQVFVLKGGDVPFILRSGVEKGSEYYSIVGDCYVHGIMDGEVARGEWRDVVLR